MKRTNNHLSWINNDIENKMINLSKYWNSDTHKLKLPAGWKEGKTKKKEIK